MKESVRNIKNKDELTENSRMIRENSRNIQIQESYIFFFLYV